MKNIRELMEWRFACKHFDSSKKISDEELKNLLDTTRLSPSSSGLQAWKFIVVTGQDIREKLFPVCDNQSQIKEASTLVFCCARTDLLGKNGVIERYAKLYQKENSKTEEETLKYEERLSKSVSSKDKEWQKNWVEKQVYIAVEVLILAAAEKAIDSCPMEGFDADGVAKVLELPKDFHPTVLVSLGFRSMTQPKKIRFDFDEVVEIRN